MRRTSAMGTSRFMAGMVTSSDIERVVRAQAECGSAWGSSSTRDAVDKSRRVVRNAAQRKRRQTYPELDRGRRCRLVVFGLEVGGRWDAEASACCLPLRPCVRHSCRAASDSARCMGASLEWHHSCRSTASCCRHILGAAATPIACLLNPNGAPPTVRHWQHSGCLRNSASSGRLRGRRLDPTDPCYKTGSCSLGHEARQPTLLRQAACLLERPKRPFFLLLGRSRGYRLL